MAFCPTCRKEVIFGDIDTDQIIKDMGKNPEGISKKEYWETYREYWKKENKIPAGRAILNYCPNCKTRLEK